MPVFEDPGPGTELVERCTVFSAVVGSRDFGLEVAGSDTDIRGVFAAPATWFWSLSKQPAVASTLLPAEPATAKVDGWLRSVRERSAREELR